MSFIYFVGRCKNKIIVDYQDLVKDIERLKWKLMEKDKDADKAMMAGRKSASTLQKSRSLEDSAVATPDQRSYLEHQFDLRMQLETVQQEASVLQDKLADVTRLNDQLVTENKKLQILAGRSSASSSSKSSSTSSHASKLDDAAVSDLMWNLVVLVGDSVA